jgi:hypothetical protein
LTAKQVYYNRDERQGFYQHYGVGTPIMYRL